MEWIVIGVAGVLVLAAAVAIAAAGASAASERALEAREADRAAIWAAGFSPRSLRVLAGLATLARAEIGAHAVEVVLRVPDGSGEGMVVTGSRLPPGRLGARVPDLSAVEGLVVPIAGGAIVAVGTFTPAQVAHLEELAAWASRELGGRVSDTA